MTNNTTYNNNNNEWVKVYSPATISNLGCGIDVLACAINNPEGDFVIARKREQPGVEILQILGLGDKNISYDPQKNTAGYAAIETLAKCKAKGGVELKILKNSQVPLGSGFGSSASSAAAAAFATALLYDKRLINTSVEHPNRKELEEKVKTELIPLCARAETAGIMNSLPDVKINKENAEHADNVTAALLGGIVGVNPLYTEKGDLYKYNVIMFPPINYKFLTFSPYKIFDNYTERYVPYTIRTAAARLSLPRHIKFNDFKKNLGNLMDLVATLSILGAHLNKFEEGSYKRVEIEKRMSDKFKDCIRKSDDCIIQSAWADKVIPWYSNVKKAAYANGASACALTGLGSSFFVICPSRSQIFMDILKDEVISALSKEAGLIANVYESEINTYGTEQVFYSVPELDSMDKFMDNIFEF